MLTLYLIGTYTTAHYTTAHSNFKDADIPRRISKRGPGVLECAIIQLLRAFNLNYPIFPVSNPTKLVKDVEF